MEPDAETRNISSYEPIDGAEAVAATAPKADLTKRAIAAVIDGVVAGILGIVPGVGGLLGGIYILVRDGLDVEYLRGRSLGKTLMNLDVVRLDGQPMDIATSVKRNWMFALGLVVAALALIPIFGWLLIPFVLIASPIIIIVEIFRVFSDPQGRRWGDLLAGTEVIETDNRIV
jgi:uncharacterized RDD family membrane protein YckC